MKSINQDYTKKVVVHSFEEEWHTSPSDGVNRIYLERDNMSEYSKASSIVEFKANSSFDAHSHENGEEIFVLEGTFSDQTGHYPKGTYLRNPHNTAHAPFSKNGCKILVKLRQFDINDSQQVIINTCQSKWHRGLVPGLSVMPLHEYKSEHVALVKWDPCTVFNTHSHWGGEEIFVIDGVFFDEYGRYPKGTWIRSPHLSTHKPFTKNEGALIFVKTGHLL
ncbi:MAG: cupin [Gammaproteobacteria bacterium]|nr:cupin [Gammaproteobacteria bacterium]|tara:strand:- start:2956 stop:3618 length:663 start_codon:yes stop_codon:yes gene_type:complete